MRRITISTSSPSAVGRLIRPQLRLALSGIGISEILEYVRGPSRDRGRFTGVIELPISEVGNDYVYYGENANGALPSPDAVFEIYKAEFDLAFQERTMFILTQHPHVGGRRSRIVQLDRLITYIKSRPDVWFATMEQVANYVKEPRS